MSDSKIVHINGAVIDQKLEPNDNVIELLEKMLHMAREGQLQAMFAVGWNVDNSIMSGWQGAHQAAFTLLGGIEQCKHEYLIKEFERRQ